MFFNVVLSILVLISLVGNALVILTILINKPMQTTLNYLLVNLAVADMISALCIGIGYVSCNAIYSLPRRRDRSVSLHVSYRR